MKKIILAMALVAFSFTAHAETPTDATKTCIDVTASLATMSESQILDSLIAPTCGMGLQEAVDAIVAAGGDLQATQTAALIIDPNFVYTDPTANLPGTASGASTVGTSSFAFTSASSLGGGGSAVSP